MIRKPFVCLHVSFRVHLFRFVCLARSTLDATKIMMGLYIKERIMLIVPSSFFIRNKYIYAIFIFSSFLLGGGGGGD